MGDLVNLISYCIRLDYAGLLELHWGLLVNQALLDVEGRPLGDVQSLGASW